MFFLNFSLLVSAYFLSFSASTQSFNIMRTPEISPIDHDPSQLFLTPLNKVLLSDELHDLPGDFFLQDHKSSEKKESFKRKRHRRDDLLDRHLFYLENNQNHFSDLFEEHQVSLSQISQLDDSEEYEEDQYESQEDANPVYEMQKRPSLDVSSRVNFDERQSTIDLSQVDYTEIIEKFAINPKQQIISSLREIASRKDLQDEFEKKAVAKDFLSKYLLQYEIHCYQKSWMEMAGDLNQIIKKIAQCLEVTFSRQVGDISYQERRVKLLKYLQKKKRRIWRKKVSYDCRKKVADGRLRIKGKFVTRDQACQQLGLKSLEKYSSDEIKDMLQRKIDFSLLQSVED